MNTSRLEAITDAVLAIIITLMVLEIKIPEISLQHIGEITQLIGIYAISFVYIAILWINHHHIFSKIARVPIQLVWINFGLIFSTTLIPLATEHLSENPTQVANHVFFGIVLGFVSLFYSILEQHVNRIASNPKQKKINLINWLSFSAFLISIPLSFINIYLSGAIFVMVPSAYFLISQNEEH